VTGPRVGRAALDTGIAVVWLAAVARAARTLAGTSGVDFFAYYLAACNAAGGHSPYRVGDALAAVAPAWTAESPTRFIYPPFAALPFVPFTWLPYGLARALWGGAGFALYAAVALAIARRAAGRRRLVLGVGGLWALGAHPFYAAIERGQVDLAIAALLAAGLALPARPRPGPAGALAGFLAGMKLYPVLYGFAFLRRRAGPAALAAALAATVVIGALAAGSGATLEFARHVLPSLDTGRSGGAFSTTAPALPSDAGLPDRLRPPAPVSAALGGSYSLLNPDEWRRRGWPAGGRPLAAGVLCAGTALVLLRGARGNPGGRPWAVVAATALALLLPPIVWTMQLNLALVAAAALLARDERRPLGPIAATGWSAWLACLALAPYRWGGAAWATVAGANLAALVAALVEHGRASRAPAPGASA
jgi:hypothetical protein